MCAAGFAASGSRQMNLDVHFVPVRTVNHKDHQKVISMAPLLNYQSFLILNYPLNCQLIFHPYLLAKVISMVPLPNYQSFLMPKYPLSCLLLYRPKPLTSSETVFTKQI